MKLEDIPKKGVFKVPDGYFEELPSKIQKRIDTPTPGWQNSFGYKPKLQWAMLVAVLFAVGIFWYRQTIPTKDAETLLAAVSTEDLISYLNESDVTTDEVFDHID